MKDNEYGLWIFLFTISLIFVSIVVWIKWIIFQHIHPGISFGWFLLSGN